jgi:hypothetical protein
MNMEDFVMGKDVVSEEVTERDVEVLEPNKIRVSVFDFKKDWALVEPHLNDPEVLEELNAGMLAFSQDHGWKHLPLWNPNNDIGPWEYARGDGHATYALDKASEDPEARALDEKYEKICEKEGFTLEDAFDGEPENPKMDRIVKAYWEEWNEIQRKYLPKKNTYRWYQCTFAGLYLKDWQLALAKKVFPDYTWRVYEEHDSESKSCKIAHIGKGPNQNFLIFNIILFELYSADEMLESVGLDRNSLEEEPIDRLMRRILN